MADTFTTKGVSEFLYCTKVPVLSCIPAALSDRAGHLALPVQEPVPVPEAHGFPTSPLSTGDSNGP